MKRLTHILLIVLVLTAAYVYAWPSANVPYFARDRSAFVRGLGLRGAADFHIASDSAEGPTASRLGWLLLALGGILGCALDLHRHAACGMAAALRAHRCVRGGLRACLFPAGRCRRGFLAGGFASGMHSRRVVFGRRRADHRGCLVVAHGSVAALASNSKSSDRACGDG